MSIFVMVPMLATACAQIPTSTVTASQLATLSCAELDEQTAELNKTKAIAEEAKGDSWHAVVPVVVAARYRHAASAYNEAEKRLTLVSEHASRLGCGPQASSLPQAASTTAAPTPSL
ncbi:hypothetical protein [Xanthomonas maliensis]|uniref:hypothetical protein n=1 Tax=Xanthomonas maliensis TaxID=1321368 RepID=UPI001264058E|nr:hypothetical protein [Xanthomonas maliensis]